MKGWDEE